MRDKLPMNSVTAVVDADGVVDVEDADAVAPLPLATEPHLGLGDFIASNSARKSNDIFT